MILLDTSYISPLLYEILVKQDISMFDIQQKQFLDKPHMDEKTIINTFLKKQRIIANSEEAYTALNEFYAEAQLTKNVNLFKNKVAFRKRMDGLHPHFYFREVSINQLSQLQLTDIPYPIILKPSIGYSSVGVYRIENELEFKQIINQLQEEMKNPVSSYTTDVLDRETFILESYIEGQEFAVDAYYNDQGEAVILNLFSRMFANERDMSDRIYYTSKEILQKNLQQVTNYVQALGNELQLTNMPLHVELRINDLHQIMPIEVNPLRFAGIGTTELGFYAYKVNPYEYYFKQQKPDWPQLIEQMDNQIYSFTCAEFESGFSKKEEIVIQHDLLKKQFHHILDYRHIPYEQGSTFAVIFFSSDTLIQNKHILSLDFMWFVEKKAALLHS